MRRAKMLVLKAHGSRVRLFAVVLLVASFLGATAPAQDSPRGAGKYSAAGLDDEREVEQFFLSFKEAVAAGDRRRVASMVSYPIRVVNASGRQMRIRDARAFVRNYDAIFGARLKQFVARTEVKDLWAKWSGVATPRGEIWFNGIVRDRKNSERYEIKITAINGVMPDDE